jgi:hypothetical protein
MKHLKRFNELNITGTYLDKTNIPKSDTYSTSGIKKTTSDLLSKKGKIFKDEPTTTSEPILNFKVQTKSGNKTSHRIIFPTNFLDQDTDTTTMYNLLDDSDVVKIPMKELLEDKFIVTEGKFNRIHFTTFEDTNLPASDGVPRDLRGIGLGYLIYDNFIKHLGFASSNNNHTSNESMSLWNKIATDPDFLCILLKEDKNRGEIMAIHKGFAETEKIAFEFIENLSPNTKEILIDDELMKLPKVVEIKTKFDSLERDPDGFVKTIKNGKTFVHYRPFRIGEE